MSHELIEGRLHRLDLGFVNAYLVDDGEVTLVDTGIPRSVGSLRAELTQAGYDAEALDRVLLTHFDLDHAGGLAGLGGDVPIYAMEPDASFTDGSAKPPPRNHKGLFQRLTGLLYTPTESVDRLADGETVGSFTAHHTPGHTPGHTVYLHDELPVALLGDLVREDDGRLERPPWFINYDTGQVVESVRGLASLEPAFDVAAMGHGEPLVDAGDAALQELASRLR